jgi:hypothetical protein
MMVKLKRVGNNIILSFKTTQHNTVFPWGETQVSYALIVSLLQVKWNNGHIPMTSDSRQVTLD